MLKDYILEGYGGFTKLQRSYKGDWLMDSVPHLRSGILFFIRGPWAAPKVTLCCCSAAKERYIMINADGQHSASSISTIQTQSN